MTVGKRVKEIRKEKKLTLRELSKKVDISISFLSDIENGRSNPSLKRIKDIADALGTSVSVLLGEEEKPDNSSADLSSKDAKNVKTLDEEISRIMRELGPDITLQFYDLKGVTDDEKENLKIFLQGLKARREQKRNK